MCATLSFCLGYGLSSASSTSPWDFLWAEKIARECSSVHPSALPSWPQKSKSTSAPLVGGRAVHINNGRSSTWPWESVETAGCLGALQNREYNVVFCWCFDLHSHRKLTHAAEFWCDTLKPAQAILLTNVSSSSPLRSGTLPQAAVIGWHPDSIYNQSDPPWRCACSLKALVDSAADFVVLRDNRQQTAEPRCKVFAGVRRCHRELFLFCGKFIWCSTVSSGFSVLHS